MSGFRTETIAFLSDNHKLSGSVCIPDGTTSSPTVLIFHGGGKDGVNHFTQWQEYLAARKIASMFFFFRGCGTSEGVYSDGSLARRVRDGINAYGFIAHQPYVKSDSICVLGSSMGGHVAVRVSQSCRFSGILLFGAAMYNESAEKKPLNEAFTAVIRNDTEWEQSPVRPILAHTEIPVFLAYGQFDTVIPEKIKLLYRQALKPTDTSIVLPYGTHALLDAESEPESQAKGVVFSESELFLRRLFHTDS